MEEITKIIPEDYVVDPSDVRGVNEGLGENAHMEYCIADLGLVCKLRGVLYERLKATMEVVFGEDCCLVPIMRGEKGYVVVSCVGDERVVGATVHCSPSSSQTSDISFPTSLRG